MKRALLYSNALFIYIPTRNKFRFFVQLWISRMKIRHLYQCRIDFIPKSFPQSTQYN